MYNMMSCSGWGSSGFSILGDCSMAWISFVLILFLALVARRQCEDGFLSGTGFNLIGAFVLGLGGNFLITALTGSARWSLVAGVIGVAVGGYVGGLIYDQAGDRE
jgi:hypothetical protein